MPERPDLTYKERKERPEKCRLVFTGLGAFSPIGRNTLETWNNLLRAENHAERIVDERFRAQVAIPINDYDPLEYFPKRDLPRLGRATQFSLIASGEAMRDAEILDDNGKLINSIPPMRAGAQIGTGIGGIEDYARAQRTIEEKGPRNVDPFAVLRILPDRVSSAPTIEYGLRGWSGTTVVACATGARNIADAAILIQADKTDLMVCGAVDGTLSGTLMEGFGQMRALAHDYNDDPKRASRPFNVDSKGFVPSEGAFIFVLEELNHARNRGAKIYAELVGMHCSADANNAVTSDADVIAKTIELSLNDAKVCPNEVDLIVAHATSTGVSELSECEAFRKVFGDQLGNIKITAPKSILGHSLGAAGAANTFVAIKAIQEGLVPPTINLDTPDPRFADLDIVTEPTACRVDVVLVNAFGFGGLNSVLTIRRYNNNS